MELSRRRMIQAGIFAATSVFTPGRSAAFPLPDLLGHPEASFVREYIRRYLKWYLAHWNIESSAKKQIFWPLVNNWLKEVNNFGVTKGSTFTETFMTRHLIRPEKVTHGRLYFGLPHWPPALLREVQKLTGSQKTQDFPWSEFYGFSMDCDEGTSRLYFWNEEERLSVYKLNQIKPESLISPLKEIPASAHPGIVSKTLLGGFHVEYGNGASHYKVRTRSTLFNPLEKGIKSLAMAHKKEFHQATDFLDTSTDKTLKIYYP